uniref:SWIM-type domain-containing protein n=1 Tax=Lactuca sativa TaxID=4236 RepID=A0A9R1XWH6_LACSA|nr:hypothetical protein LSAT_V11C200086500 [Lactuca sativa]
MEEVKGNYVKPWANLIQAQQQGIGQGCPEASGEASWSAPGKDSKCAIGKVGKGALGKAAGECHARKHQLDPIYVQSVSGTDELNVLSLAQSDDDIATEGEPEAGQDRFSEFFSPGGTRKIWILEDVDDVKPKLFSEYLSIKDAMDMYRAYAAKASFDVRKERHNHDLVAKDYKHFLRSNRQLDNAAQEFIEKMGRDDAQMVVDKYMDRMKDDTTLTFEFICEKGKLVSLSWFSKMFHMIETWIPAYFRDMPLSGLMRTTSRSESMNSAFNKISHWGNSLVKFFSSFDSAMDRQRHNQCYLDHLSNISKIKSKISLKIMEHAADIDTNEVLIKVKKEIEQSLFSCSQYSVTNEEFYDRFVVMQYKDIMGSTPTVVNEEDSESECDVPEKTYFFKKESRFECTCSLFFQNGILCRHIFCIFRTYQINKIPSKYILRRWCKGVIPYV